MGVYGPHTQFKCLLEAMIFGTCTEELRLSEPLRRHSLSSDMRGIRIDEKQFLGGLYLGDNTIF